MEVKDCEDCGTSFEVKRNHHVRKFPNKCRSCSGKVNKSNFSHGERSGGKRPSLYVKWVGMRSRCYSEKDKDYPKFGGVGIRMQESWEKDYKAFEAWAMENGYEDGDQIKRVKQWGNYSALNCTVVKKVIALYECGGRSRTAKQWYKHFNVNVVSYRVFNKRLQSGWDVFRAATNAPMSNATTTRIVERYKQGTNIRI